MPAKYNPSPHILQKAMNNKDEWLAFVETCLHFLCDFFCCLFLGVASFALLLLFCKSSKQCEYVCGACLHGLRQWCTLAAAIIQKHFSDQCLSSISPLASFSLSFFATFLACPRIRRPRGEKLMHAKWWCFLRIVSTSHFLPTFWSLIKFYILWQHWPGLCLWQRAQRRRRNNSCQTHAKTPTENPWPHTVVVGWLFSFCTQSNENDCAVINFNLPKSSCFIHGEMGIWFWCRSITLFTLKWYLCADVDDATATTIRCWCARVPLIRLVECHKQI